MGEKHDLHCTKCGYGIEAWLGIGMMYAPTMVFEGEHPSLVDLVDDADISSQALKLVQDGQVIADNYEHEIYACPDDFYLFTKLYFKVGEYEPQYPCPYDDGKILQRLTFAKGQLGSTRLQFVDSKQFWHCPKCGNDELNEYSFANWD